MGDQYEPDDDGYPRELVGPWALDKHHLLRHYVNASRAARGKMGGTHCFIDLYCGPGKARIRGTQQVIEGGTVVAVDAAAHCSNGKAVPFGKVFIGDLLAENVTACKVRLAQRFNDAQITPLIGGAESTVQDVVRQLPKRGIHLAYLDPYSLAQLPFSVPKALSSAPHVDLLMHFAASDMARNLERPDLWGNFDAAAPGWRDALNTLRGKSVIRQQFFSYWIQLLERLGYYVSERAVPVRNTKRREIYRLVLASKHKLGDGLWRTLNDKSGQTGFSF